MMGMKSPLQKKDFHQFTHAYCCSIHKSQGSEFPIVVLPVVRSYYRMLRRNLLYTAITRSKKFLILCGEESALEWGVKNNEDSLRQTSLTMRLVQTEQIMDAELEALQKSFRLAYMTQILAWRESLHLILCMSRRLPYGSLLV
ncbi:hypothetical protein BsIDN1_47470 [Bacillus safensis]|uniref:UvrD-like helicase C-terminal domain-containing protein n=1 Tax=Bacillus safensis TaxID=561879 RepID=A0A5S9MH35_BACIA|nr:hypothetical protein BsIDN1_47470 [Bacillus safensis]